MMDGSPIIERRDTTGYICFQHVKNLNARVTDLGRPGTRLFGDFDLHNI